MARFNYFAAAVSFMVIIIIYRVIKPGKPEITSKYVWWGRQSEQTSARDDRVRPFRINITDKVIEDLKSRLANTRPSVEPLEMSNFEFGFDDRHLTKIVDYWLNRYDWAARQAYMNTFPQYMTQVYGLDIHFIHAKQRGNIRVVPLLLLHGWPGSVVEFYKIIPMLTEPGTGEERDFAFEVIAPSLPGYGFSDGPRRPGMGPAQVGQVFVKLMDRLGHKKFYVHGGDWGVVITDAISKIFPDRVYGIHSCMRNAPLSLCNSVWWKHWLSFNFSIERTITNLCTLSNLLSTFIEETGHAHLHISKPDTAGVALDDSPVGLAAFILEKFSTGVNFDNLFLPNSGLTKYNIDELLDNVMVYWVTGSMTTSMRLYFEYATKAYQALPQIRGKVPTAWAMFPNEILQLFYLRKPYERNYINLFSATEMEEGVHFRAFKHPELFAEDIWLTVFKMEKIKN